jgi:hypothetical protein
MAKTFTSPLSTYIIKGCHYYHRLSHFCANKLVICLRLFSMCQNCLFYINSNRHPVETFFSFWLTMFRTQSVGMFIIYLDLQFHIPLDKSIRPTCQYYGCMFLFSLITHHVNRMKKYGRLTSLIIDYYLFSSVTVQRDYVNPSIQSRHNMKIVLIINRLLKGIVRSPKSKKRWPVMFSRQ